MADCLNAQGSHTAGPAAAAVMHGTQLEVLHAWQVLPNDVGSPNKLGLYP